MEKPSPNFDMETALLDRGLAAVAGVDEVGRGPLAGPVVAAAVILDLNHIPQGLNDSKKLGLPARERLFDQIAAQSVFAIGEANVEEIDTINILNASHLAMKRAIAALRIRPDHVLIDGNRLPKGLDIPASPIVRGDARVLSISAASIMAKIWRDKGMYALAQQYPGYGWERNAGYPTPEHKKALRDLGVTPHHRRSFKPVHNML